MLGAAQALVAGSLRVQQWRTVNLPALDECSIGLTLTYRNRIKK
jgi:hypothetical protein